MTEPPKRFPIASTRSDSPWVWPALIFLPVILITFSLAIVVLFAGLKAPRGSEEAASLPWILGGMLAMILASGAGAYGLSRWPSTTTFEVDREGLRIRSPFYARSFAREMLKLDEAKIVDLSRAATLAPLRSAGRMIGINLPGRCLGTYKMNDGSIALLYVAYPFVGPIVFLPTTGPYHLVLSPADPAGFLEALRGGITIPLGDPGEDVSLAR